MGHTNTNVCVSPLLLFRSALDSEQWAIFQLRLQLPGTCHRPAVNLLIKLLAQSR